MVKLQEAENQIVVDYELYDRRPNDADLLIPAIETHQARLGRAPYLMAADAAFYSGKNEAAAKAKGVKRVRAKSLHKKLRAQTRAEEVLVPQRSEVARWIGGAHQRGQTKRRHGLDRCRFKATAACGGLGVIGDNLVTLGNGLARMPNR